MLVLTLLINLVSEWWNSKCLDISMLPLLIFYNPTITKTMVDIIQVEKFNHNQCKSKGIVKAYYKCHYIDSKNNINNNI
jgi:hypothetical protein